MRARWYTRESKVSMSPSIHFDLFSGKSGAPFSFYVLHPTMNSSSRIVTLILSRISSSAMLMRVNGGLSQFFLIDRVR